MSVPHIRPLRLVAASLILLASAVEAQQRPTTAEAQSLLQSRPDLVAQLRQRVQRSGMTPDQIRARLRAEGYPENLLDAYMAGMPAAGDTVTPGQEVLSAVTALGLADAAELAAAMAIMMADTASAGDTVSSGLPIFGLSAFRRGTSQFEANLSGPVDPGYKLGPRDQLVLILTGEVELAHTLEVTREGFVVIPQVGQIYVANLTLAQLEDVLYQRLGRVYSGVRRGTNASTRFSVSVARLRTNQVFVVGDVEAPGSYQVSSVGTALTALYAAGGPSINGSLRRIEIRRAGAAPAVLDVYDYLLRGDASNDVRLETGDVIFVPVHGPRVEISGEIVRPAAYELKPGETLRDLIRAAGGFTHSASLRRVQIRRILPPERRAPGGRDRVVLDVSGEQFDPAEGPALPLEPGDQVTVFPVAEREWRQITVEGHVWSPGPQGFRPGTRLSDAIRQAGGVKPDVLLGQVLVTRLQQDSTRVVLRSALRDTSGVPTSDILLEEDDVVRVFSVTEFRPERYVVVSGAVRGGGRVPFRENMTLRDAILLAGGLQESADLREAEVARLPSDRSDGRLAETIRVGLDSTYLFERRPDGTYLGPPGIPVSANGASDFTLMPYDNVLVLRQPEWELQRTVVITGEVASPGRYSLRSKDERLSDLLTRAGGLTDEGYADGVTFYRRENRTGRVGIDLPAVLRGDRRRDDLILVDGDSIHIPEYNPVVTVTGAVNSPIGVAHVPGQGLAYYIESAGGTTQKADLKRAYVRQPNGTVEAVRIRPLLVPNDMPEPRAGATVVVPEEDPDAKRDYAAIAGSIAQVLASVVAIIAIATR